MKPQLVILAWLLISTQCALGQFNFDSIRKSIESTPGTKNKIETLYDALESLENAEQDTLISYANWGIRLSRKAKDRKAESQFLGIRAIQQIRLSKYSEALKDLFSALSISESLDDSLRIGNVLNNIGNVYRATNKLDNAKDYYTRALTIQQSIGDSSGISFSYNNLGIIYMMQAKYDQGMELWGKSLEMKLAVGDSSAAAATLGNMAMYYRDIGETKKALNYLHRAEAIELATKDYHGLAINYSNVAELYSKQNNFLLAFDYYDKSIAYGKKANSREVIAETYSKMTRTYEYMGDFRSALECYRKQIAIQNEILDEKTQKDLVVLESKFVTQQQADKLELLKAEDKAKAETIARQNTNTWALVIGLCLALVIALVMIRGYLRKQRANRMISKQKDQVSKQHEALEEKNREIVDSITYAKRLQTAILPSKTVIENELKDSFVMYQPKDIVAGDFYWVQRVGDILFFAVADCTGHGVPGAMVSVVCSNALNRSVNEFSLLEPGEILDKSSQLVTETFQMDNDEVNDGMDIALCAWNKKTDVLTFAGAHNSLYIVSDHQLKEVKSDRQPVGAYENPVPFTTKEVSMQSGDMLYLVSDGFADQFGGPNGKKFKSVNLKRLFVEQSGKDLESQRQHFLSTFNGWKGDLDQIDDVCLIGVRV